MPVVKSRAKRGVETKDLLLTAFDLYSAEGDEGFSVRKLAAACGVDPMTVLHHFGSKNELLRAIADHAVTLVAPPVSTGDWRRDLRAVADAYRVLAHRHPRVVHLHFRFHATGPADHVASEIVYAAMLRAGISDRAAANHGLAFYTFVLGFALAEAEGLIKPIADADEAELMQLEAANYPATRRLVPVFKSLEPDIAFSDAMNAYIAGIATLAPLP